MPLFTNPVTASIGSVEVEQILELVNELLIAYRVDRIPTPPFDKTVYYSRKSYQKEINRIVALNKSAMAVNCMFEIRTKLTEQGIYNRKRNPNVSFEKLRIMYDLIDDYCATNSIKNEYYHKFKKELDSEFSDYIDL